MSESKYAQRGVSAGKEDVHKAIKNLDKGLYPNAFCKILPDLAAGDANYVNIMHADTAGTKTSLAYLYWKETGDVSVWEGIVQDAMVMNLDDMACAGMTNDFILSSTIGRNKNLVDGSVVVALIGAQKKLADKMAEFGVNLHLAGGETADVGDIVRTADVGFTAFGRLPKADVIDINIKEGDVIVGLASYGQASYEDEYNSGIGSNGLTFARHEVLLKAYADKYPDSFDPNLNENVVYTGKSFLTDSFEDAPLNIGKMLLSPTRTFVPVLKAVIEKHRSQINGIIHNTGGGLAKVLHFAGDVSIQKNKPLPIPPVFRMIQQQTGAPWQEMFQVFNMGQRIEFYVPAEIADSIIEISKSFNIHAQVMGHVQKGPKEVVVRHGDLEYVYK
ncbi:MAG: phosphoribosylformylglycinamidine cyclo-ligase [Bacteroidetes bacterium]|nr:phosphoribosylformylglycinamidine cyclo-ligase [Bacteroidota bacterium]